MRDPFEVLPAAFRARLRRCAQPDWIPPMLATLVDRPFSRRGWIFERKLDGVRCLVFRKGARVRLLSRNRKPMNATFPELVDEIERQPCDDFVADGEIVAFDGERTSFARLQGRLGVQRAADALRRGIPVYLYFFDLLHLRGHEVTRLPLRERKLLLERAISFGDCIRYTAHREAEGEAYLREVCARGWEGLVAKDASAPYVHKRSRKWLKLKCITRQELVIGGYTEPRGTRKHFGALLVGYYDDGELRYAGKVGSGFDDRTLEELGDLLARMERSSSPFADRIGERSAHFVEPALVAEIGFSEWTAAGKLRQPRYCGLRLDKPAQQVRRERPAHLSRRRTRRSRPRSR